MRTRVMRWLREQVPAVEIAAPDQASQITSLAETGTWEQFGQRLWAELWERGRQSFAASLAKAADIKMKSDYLHHLQRATRKPTTATYTAGDYQRAASYFYRLASAEEARQGKLLEEHLNKGDQHEQEARP